MTLISHLADCLLRLGLRPLTPADEQVFRRLWIASGYPRYADSWAYLVQSTNGYHLGLHPLGYVAIAKDAALAANFFHRPTDGIVAAHIVNPVGGNVASLTCQIAESITDELRVPVYIKNVAQTVAKQIAAVMPTRIRQPEPWHREAILEDSTEPEVTLTIERTLRLLTSAKNEVKDKYNRLLRGTSAGTLEWRTLTARSRSDALSVIHAFFSHKRAHHIDISGPEDYFNMVAHPAKTDGFGGIGTRILYCEERPVALLVMEGLATSDAAGVYCNLTLYQETPYLSEYVIIEACRLASNQGYRFLNLGGSESSQLTRFKRKFRPTHQGASGAWLMVTCEDA